jgi:hypothetical protein
MSSTLAILARHIGQLFNFLTQESQKLLCLQGINTTLYVFSQQRLHASSFIFIFLSISNFFRLQK